MDEIPGIRNQQPEIDPDIPQDAESDDPLVVVNNLSEEQLTEAWDVEATSWVQIGLNPGVDISVDQFQLRAKTDVAIRMLIEAGILNEDEFNNRVKRLMLANMIELRKQFEKQQLQAKLMEGVHLPVPKPEMFLPPGMKKDG